MVRNLPALLLMATLLSPAPARAIWQDELFGDPGPAYFRAAYPKLLSWVEERYLRKGALGADALEYLRACARNAPGWYHPEGGGRRLARFRVTLSAGEHGTKHLRIRCLPHKSDAALSRLAAKLLREAERTRPKISLEALGLELTPGSSRLTVILAGRELTFDGAKLLEEAEAGEFRPGPPPGFAHAPLALASSELKSPGRLRHRVELRAYLHGVAPAALRADIEAFHREFGLLADSLTVEAGAAAEVSFP